MAASQHSRRYSSFYFYRFQDCLARARHESKYIIMQDIDERFTPTADGNLRDYVTWDHVLYHSIIIPGTTSRPILISESCLSASCGSSETDFHPALTKEATL